jgi:hypothetical protein
MDLLTVGEITDMLAALTDDDDEGGEDDGW